MKEVTYEDWQKNPTPRMMWVWDDNEYKKGKYKVLYILSEEELPDSIFRVIALTLEPNCVVGRYTHCAEIEKPRRMTSKELSRWLREKPTREFKYKDDDFIYHQNFYSPYNQDKAVADDILIRENGGEWREPLVEVEE